MTHAVDKCDSELAHRVTLVYTQGLSKHRLLTAMVNIFPLNACLIPRKNVPLCHGLYFDVHPPPTLLLPVIPSYNNDKMSL